MPGARKTKSAPALPAPPGGPIEIVFSFDTTGSMSSVLGEVRNKVQDIINRLLADIPCLRIAVFAHGDYCDHKNYVTKCVDFTNDPNKLCKFVQNVKGTYGGDWEECYELVLKQVRENLSWSAGTQKSLVMIGDAIPHSTTYADNVDNIDWKEEARRLYEETGCRVYAVQAGRDDSIDFWKDLATRMHGKHLYLEQFETIIDMIMAICYREHDPNFFEAHEREVRAREGPGIRDELNQMFDVLRDGLPDSSDSSAVPPAKESSPLVTRKRKHDKIDPDVCSSDAKSKTKKRKVAPPKKPYALKKSSSSITAGKVVKKARKVITTKRCKTFAISKQKRETVPQTRFILNKLSWSAWYEAMTVKPPKTGGDSWIPRTGDRVGVRKSTLFTDETECPAVYEFAVQPAARSKKYPVYVSTTNGFSHRCWDTYLMKQERLRNQVDDVLKKGCKLYLRRSKFSSPVTCQDQTLNTLRELKNLISKTYDYAWNASRQNGYSQRIVEKKGIRLSA